MAQTTVTIIGLGNVGTALLNVFPKVGYPVISAFSRKIADERIQKSHSDIFFGEGIPKEGEPLGDLIFLTISDDAIQETSEQLAANISTLDGKKVIHCSGVFSSNILAAAKEKHAEIASFHPIKSITKQTDTFSGIWFDIEGDDDVLNILESIVQDLEAKSFRIAAEAKPFLHASAVVASNYLVVLANLMSQISTKAGISEDVAMEAFSPLIQNTLSNIQELGVVDALTGPIARGDVKTVESHLNVLQNYPELSSLYKELGKSATEIAQKKSGEKETIHEIRTLFEQKDHK